MNANELLKPSLRTNTGAALYSQRAMFWVAFLGGIVAIVPFSVLNMHRLKVLRKDFWLPTILGSFLIVLFAVKAIYFGRENAAIITRGLAFLYFGSFYWRYKELLNAESRMNNTPASPWIPAFACLAFSTVLAFLLAAWILRNG